MMGLLDAHFLSRERLGSLASAGGSVTVDVPLAPRPAARHLVATQPQPLYEEQAEEAAEAVVAVARHPLGRGRDGEASIEMAPRNEV